VSLNKVGLIKIELIEIGLNAFSRHLTPNTLGQENGRRQQTNRKACGRDSKTWKDELPTILKDCPSEQ
jgi:hypothetical protein